MTQPIDEEQRAALMVAHDAFLEGKPWREVLTGNGILDARALAVLDALGPQDVGSFLAMARDVGTHGAIEIAWRVRERLLARLPEAPSHTRLTKPEDETG